MDDSAKALADWTQMNNVLIIVCFIALALLAGFLWIDRNHLRQIYIAQSEAQRVCDEFVGVEDKCMLIGQDGGVEGQTYIFKDGAMRVLHLRVSASQIYPIFAVKRAWAREDFELLQCDEKTGKCTSIE